MHLIERYLAAIARGLPAAKAADITAELRDELLSRIEHRESVLGRALDHEEQQALVREFGHPLLVASRYRPHQHLIGPGVFPFYLAALRIVMVAVAAFIVAVAAVLALFGDQSPQRTALQGVAGLWTWLPVAFASVTLLFAGLERTGLVARRIGRWAPKRLPEVSDRLPGHWESAFEVGTGIAFLLWWTGAITLPFVAGTDRFRIVAAPVFTQLHGPILLLAAVQLVNNLIRWLLPRWKLARGLFGAATAIGGLALLWVIYQAGSWVVVTPTAMSAAEAAGLQRSLDAALRIGIIAVAVVWTFGALGGLYQMVRRGRATDPATR